VGARVSQQQLINLSLIRDMSVENQGGRVTATTHTPTLQITEADRAVQKTLQEEFERLTSSSMTWGDTMNE
jgi:hypothetical protein